MKSQIKLPLSRFDFPRAAAAETLFEISKSANKFANEDWQLVIRDEIDKLRDRSILVITGSLYFISEVKPVIVSICQK